MYFITSGEQSQYIFVKITILDKVIKISFKKRIR